ncbi:splicing factor 3b [Metarhizium rileyi]|uniref:Splicing factor 3b n=1 Tax=Metarhizium rileyi (strain RCEF 4871) TaxID=1649241 RepID=A0A167ESD6_METRR|nr:splicing factor 3b [Metarhizium rileyi RCEF 4871]
MATTKMTKNQMRRAKKKEQKKTQKSEVRTRDPKTVASPTSFRTRSHVSKAKLTFAQPTDESGREKAQQLEKVEDINTASPVDPSNDKDEINNHLTEPLTTTDAPDLEDTLDEDPAFAAYKDIFSKFGALLGEDEVAKEANAGNQGTVCLGDDDGIPDEDDADAKPKLSKKKRKELNKLSVAELKALVSIPEVVEWHDVSSSDPRVLVQIKAQRNVIPVPTHWSLKREYLSSKRGIEKAPFRLPQFISDTGITEMRDAVLEKQAEQTLKQKQRERVAPKMGRLDIDYQKLYDAFFRFQTKPELTRFGEVYYEGKEAEVDYQHFRPGDLTDATKEALGMPVGAPPPWLINQQRFGPPPSYPTLKIPGLNAPPPPGGSWGFHPGGWGKPPVDDSNRPLYGGDVFGLAQNGAQPQAAQAQLQIGEAVERTLWGELQPREEESEEEEEESEEEEEDNADAGGLETPGGMETPSGYSTNLNEYASGVETSIAGEMDLRKERRGYDTEESSAPRSAYTVLPERQVRAEGFFGSDRVYDLKAGQRAGMQVLGSEDESRKRKKPGDVDVALDVDSLNQHDGINRDALRQQFEETNRQEGLGAKWAHDDDLTDLIAEESRKRQRTERERQDKKKESRYRL